MDLWMKIGSGLLLLTMFVVLLPRARQMVKESPKAGAGDWRAAIVPVLFVVGFVVFLLWIV